MRSRGRRGKKSLQMSPFRGVVVGCRRARLGLSRRRSRVRVPSLPLKTSCIGIFCCQDGRERPPVPALIPHVLGKGLLCRACRPTILRCAASIPREIGSGGATIARVAASAAIAF